MDDFLTRKEHEEFRRSMDIANKKLEDENRRQNKRLENLEENAKENTELVANVGRLAVNMENMLKVQEALDKRLERLENKDGEMWRKVVGHAVTAIVGAVVCYFLTRIGM